jgi:hypothetical protein
LSVLEKESKPHDNLVVPRNKTPISIMHHFGRKKSMSPSFLLTKWSILKHICYSSAVYSRILPYLTVLSAVEKPLYYFRGTLFSSDIATEAVREAIPEWSKAARAFQLGHLTNGVPIGS